MFASLVLPFGLTCLAAGVLALVLFGRGLRRGRTPVGAIGSAGMVAGALFLPLLLAVGFVVDAFRYGEFTYASAAEIGDPNVEIPATATDITLYKSASGHTVRFQVDQELLLRWMDSVAQKRREYTSDNTAFVRDAEEPDLEFRRYLFDTAFGHYDWPMPADVVRYQGWRSGRGGGYDVWYSPATRTGFIAAAYW